MDTNAPSLLDKLPARIRKALMRAVVDAVEMRDRLEMSNIPAGCWESAAASWLAVNRKPTCWVTIQVPKGKTYAYDLRPGREAVEKKGS